MFIYSKAFRIFSFFNQIIQTILNKRSIFFICYPKPG